MPTDHSDRLARIRSRLPDAWHMGRDDQQDEQQATDLDAPGLDEFDADREDDGAEVVGGDRG